MKNFIETLETTEILIILVLIGLLGYGIYYTFQNGFCNVLPFISGCNNPCKGMPAGATCLDSSGNYQTNPVSYSTATTDFWNNPVAGVKSIVSGWFGN